ncbi:MULTISPECIES: DUF3426 domain-containing protein [unclassified Pseudomonas]|uniref:DUF3426 domain-containing protein n=1 Tax=unclassified Pseudomonas TaxID=196821 RepID=UPI0035C02280
MTDSFVTQCPHCQTSFRVTHHQLSVARGVVRCGQCLQVFNAARQLLEQSQAANAATQPLVPVTAPPSAVEPPAVVAPPVVPVKAPEVAPLPPSQDDWASTTQALDELDLDQELALLERRGAQPERQAKGDADTLQARRDEHHSEEHDDKPFGTANDGDHQLEPETHPPLAQAPVEQEALDLQPAAESRTEPTLGRALDLDDEEPPVRKAAVEPPAQALAKSSAEVDDEPLVPKGFSAIDDEPAAVRVSTRDDDDEHEPAPGERLEPVLATKPTRARKEPLVDVVDDPLQLGWEKPAANWGMRLLWGVLTLLATALLAFQYIWYHFDEMARHDNYRPLFQQVCPLVGCQVPTRVDIARIKSSNLVVRSHPDFKGALIVDAILYNRAPFSQPFPLLELRFADLNGQLIASRRFKPSEYLSGELAGRGEMPSQTPIHIALDILDPGPKAVNYSLSFRSPE